MLYKSTMQQHHNELCLSAIPLNWTLLCRCLASLYFHETSRLRVTESQVIQCDPLYLSLYLFN